MESERVHFNEFERGIQLIDTETKDIGDAAELRRYGKGWAIPAEDVPAVHELTRRFMELRDMPSFANQELEREEREAQRDQVQKIFGNLDDSEKAAMRAIIHLGDMQQEAYLYESKDMVSLQKLGIIEVLPESVRVAGEPLIAKKPKNFIFTEFGGLVAEMLEKADKTAQPITMDSNE